MAMKVFNRYGVVKPNLKHHLIQKGSGVWQSELDHGPLLTIERVHVVPSELRREGLGSKMLGLLLAKAWEYTAAKTQTDPSVALFQSPQSQLDWSSSLHVLTLPGWLSADVDQRRKGKARREQHRINIEAHDAAVSFFRSCGFWRIGLSDCFAYSFTPDHPSRILAVGEDVDPLFCAVDEYEDFINPDNGETIHFNMDQYRLDGLKTSHPFHHAAETLSDEQCLAFLRDHASTVGSASPDSSQSTLLHIIPCAVKPRSLEWVLENVHQARQWQSCPDTQGLTPIEALREKLERIRSTRQVMLMTLVVSDQFKGFGTEAVRCLELLSARDGPSTPLPSLELARLQYGCTCGQCLEGFLSPRMAFALYWKGGELGDMLSEDFCISDGRSWVQWHEDAISYLARDVQANLKMNKSLRCGYGNIFSLAANCLQRKLYHEPRLYWNNLMTRVNGHRTPRTSGGPALTGLMLPCFTSSSSPKCKTRWLEMDSRGSRTSRITQVCPFVAMIMSSGSFLSPGGFAMNVLCTEPWFRCRPQSMRPIVVKRARCMIKQSIFYDKKLEHVLSRDDADVPPAPFYFFLSLSLQ
ncbi:hypothetical protein BJX62DRAFT_236365 [Aspergillus germanicus]